MKRLFAISLLAGGMLYSPFAAAQIETGNAPKDRSLDEVVVTGTRNETDAAQLSATVSVIDRKQIEQALAASYTDGTSPGAFRILTRNHGIRCIRRSCRRNKFERHQRKFRQADGLDRRTSSVHGAYGSSHSRCLSGLNGREGGGTAWPGFCFIRFKCDGRSY